MRVFLLLQNADNTNHDIYCGFYCNGTCNSYVFSVVAVQGDNHIVAWSANGERPVKANATVQLKREGLVLRDSDGTEIWASNTSANAIVGMNLNQAGNLVLFSNESDTVWQSPSEKISLTPPPPLTNLAPKGENVPKSPDAPGRRSKTRLVAVIAGSTAGGVLIIGIVIVLYLVKLGRKEEEEEEEEEEDYFKKVRGMTVRFSYEDLRVATEDFKERIGGGGFGTVFKGVLPDGSKIAVKRLDRMGQGMREFLAEVETIGSLHHFNLVRLIGFCAEKSCWLLVYEYMSNGSLDKWIFFRDEVPCLDWQTRKKIILDVAKGLTYLHEDCRQRIAHLDIKPQNILLDESFNAKVSDFGLAQLIDRDESLVQATMRGTPGYIAPEWRKSKINVKVDIYSFGIVLLEVVSARRNLDRSRSESSCHLLRMLQEKAKEDRLLDIVENLDENHREEMIRLIKIGVWCLQDDPIKRPSMSTVVKVLEGVMEVDENIKYKFAQAMPSVSIVNDRVSSAPSACILSNPR